MKNFLIKNKKTIKNPKNYLWIFIKNNSKNNQDGFVALFSVLVSSILVLMALSISGVAYKEQLLSSNAKSSQYSFVAADTGMECALYFDVSQDWYGVGNPPDDPSLLCGGDRPEFMAGSSDLALEFFIYKLRIFSDVNGVIIPSCAIFSINRQYDSDNDGTFESTKIDSRGYNVDCDNIEYGLLPGTNGQGGVGSVQFINGAGARAVERYLGAIYENGN